MLYNSIKEICPTLIHSKAMPARSLNFDIYITSTIQLIKCLHSAKLVLTLLIALKGSCIFSFGVIIIIDKVTFLAFTFCICQQICVFANGCLMASPSDVVALVAHPLGIVFLISVRASSNLTLFAVSSLD